ncbi:SRPBCC family protein [Arthrobacter sp. TMN-37]
MTFISSHQDPEALSLTFVAEFDAGVERVWQVWEDPRQLERWWGPPTYPATFERYAFVPGGGASYYMTGPEGDKFHGWWRITAIEAPRRLEYDDGFADEHGEPDTKMGETHSVMTLESVEGRTRMTTVTSFEGAEQLQQMLEMGMEEGVREAMGQIDALLDEPART